MKRNRQKYSRGFTLIELLVVIAIIGILSAVVLASLNSARAKGADAAVKSDLQSIRNEAEIFYDGVGNNTYGPALITTICPTTGSTMFVQDATIANAIKQATAATGKTVSDAFCGTDGSNQYVVVVPLKTSGYWCIDSSGQSKSETDEQVAGGSGYVCP
ncbi:MAG TPA: type II secretion system protein [Candidatus Paceibacterota bacterium]|jgi:prepilin-type N-terminal cleavage/methylation domain-containing protein|nr:type II secretion system protein [Candidatus Paceibacterota bacterium]